MCTVTFLPLINGDFIFTSNRDEQVGRETIFPKMYIEDGVQMLYPKDKKAGGTWISISDTNRLACLLNGGFVKHTHVGGYKFSRGLVVKEILKAIEIVPFIKNFDLENVEPFTLIIVDWANSLQLFELVWDGEAKHFRNLDTNPRIWSSSTLYTAEMKKERELWFAEWTSKKSRYTQTDVFNFHEDATKGTPETAVKMKRSYVETVSVTSILKKEGKLDMYYKDTLKASFVKSNFHSELNEIEINE